MSLTVMPSPWFVGLDDNGDPVAAGLLYTYEAGTSTNKATYQDSAGAVANANPVVLDAAGRAVVYLGSGGYKFVLKTAAGALVESQDNILAYQDTATSPVELDGTVGEEVDAGDLVRLSDGTGGENAGQWYLGVATDGAASLVEGGRPLGHALRAPGRGCALDDDAARRPQRIRGAAGGGLRRAGRGHDRERRGRGALLDGGGHLRPARGGHTRATLRLWRGRRARVDDARGADQDRRHQRHAHPGRRPDDGAGRGGLTDAGLDGHARPGAWGPGAVVDRRVRDPLCERRGHVRHAGAQHHHDRKIPQDGGHGQRRHGPHLGRGHPGKRGPWQRREYRPLHLDGVGESRDRGHDHLWPLAKRLRALSAARGQSNAGAWGPRLVEHAGARFPQQRQQHRL